MAITYSSSGRAITPITTNPAIVSKNTSASVSLVIACVHYMSSSNQRSGGNPTWDGNAMTQLQAYQSLASGTNGVGMEVWYIVSTTGGLATQFSVPNTTNEDLYLTVGIYDAPLTVELVEIHTNFGTVGTVPYTINNDASPVNGDLVIQNIMSYNGSPYTGELKGFSGIERYSDSKGSVDNNYISMQDDTNQYLFATARTPVAFISVWAGFQEVKTPNTAPSTPILLNPPSGSTVSTNPTLEFYSLDDNYDDITYQVQVDDTDNTFASVVIDVNSSGDTGFIDLNVSGDTDPFASGHEIAFTVQTGDTLSNGVTYYWRARANDPSGTNTWSAWNTGESIRNFTVTTSNVPPTIVLDTLDATVFNTGTPTLQFTGSDDDGDDITYEIKIDNNSGFTSTIISGASNADLGFASFGSFDTDPFTAGIQISYTVQSGDTLSADTYYWSVRAKDPSGSDTWSAYADTKTFIIQDTDDEWDKIRLYKFNKLSGLQVSNIANISGNIL